jgi:hypothetical protein
MSNGRRAGLFAAAIATFAGAGCGGSDASNATAAAPPLTLTPLSGTPTPAPSAPTPGSSPAPSPSPPPPPVPSADTCPTATGRTLPVGPGKAYATPSAAAASAQTGDLVLITPGEYRGDVATWRAANLTICGDGGRARLFADGKDAQGKGIWVIAPGNSATTTIVNVEFHDAKVIDQNGAGIRHEGGHLVLRNTGYYDNENGILGGGGPVTVTIERSEFARNGLGDGYTHNLYIGNVDRLRVVASYFHEAKIGHNLKSRAKENVIENSYFVDGVNGTSSYLLDFPDGGIVFMRGNLLHKGPKADNTTAVAYGAERNMWPTNTVTLIHNTLVNTMGRGTFVSFTGYTQQATLIANLFAGNAAPSSGIAPALLVQQNNLQAGEDNVPGAAIGDFRPIAAILPQLTLPLPADTAYTADSPQPYQLRPLMAGQRLIGALQSVR